MPYNLNILNSHDVAEGTSLIEKKFAVLQEIAGAMVSTNDTIALSYLMLDFVINYTGAQKGSLMLLNDKSELYILAARGMDDQMIRNYRVKIGEGIAGCVAQNREAVRVDDIEKDERFSNLKRDRYKTSSFISCPMISKNRLLGVLNIHDKKDGTVFSQDEFDLLTVIANQAAIVIENASLMNQLRGKAMELEEINRKLMETDAIKTEFFTRLSHELRTPLNSIKGSAYYLLMSDIIPDSERKEFYDIISSESEKLISIVEHLLDFLRLEDESRIIKKSLLNVPELIDSIKSASPLESILSRKSLTLDTAIQGEVSDIVGDRVLIMQFFLNLIDGLSLHLERNDAIHISVEDNDAVEMRLSFPRRMPYSILPYLFDSQHIFRSDQPEEGIKLYLAWKIADAHKWNLNAMNTDGGFTLKITVPKSTRQIVETAINDSMGMFIEFMSAVMDVNTCSIMLCDDLTGDLTIRKAKGLEDSIVRGARLRLGERIAGWVALKGEALLIENIETHSVFSRKNIPRYGSGSLLTVPLKIKGKVVGVVNFNNKKTLKPFSNHDLILATMMAERVSRFIEMVKDREYSGDSLKQFMSHFDTLLDAERRYHKKNGDMSHVITSVMEVLDASDVEKKCALYASVIYDLGLMLIDENILNKKTLLPAEVRALRAHPHFTVNLLEGFEFSDEVRKAVLHHHERYDGQGYPEGLREENIPLISRVLSVVDAFCAMTSERTYRKKLTRDEALEEIKKGSGAVFDPKVVSALERILYPGIPAEI